MATPEPTSSTPPAFKATERLFSQTTAPIRNQIRPFTRQIRPVLVHANEASQPLDKTVTSFGNALGGLNSFFNELSYKPKGSKQSFLFYLPWLNHDFNAAFNLQNPGGPILRGMNLISCNGIILAYGLAGESRPSFKTLLQLLNIPQGEKIKVPGSKRGICDLQNQ